MPILTRYVLAEYLKFIGLLLGALLMVYFTIHVLEKMKRFSELSVPFFWIAQYLILKLPKMISDLMPLALFLATLLTLGALSKNNEVVPIFSAGISIVWLTLPILFVGGMVTALFFVLNGSVVPSTYKRARVIQQENIEKRGGATLFQNKIWFRLNSQTLLYTQVVHPEENAMYGVHLYYLGNAMPIAEEIEAESLRVGAGGQWVLSNGTRLRYQKDGTMIRSSFLQEEVHLGKTLVEIQQIDVQPEEMTYTRLSSYIDQLQRDGLDATRYQVGLQQQWAFPFANFILVLLGIPIALQYLQRGGTAKSVLFGLVVVLLYWLLLSIAASFGRLQIVSPFVAGWGPHVLFLLMGASLFLRLHRLSG